MKNLYLKSILLFLICFISYSSTTLAQSVSVADDYPNTLTKRVGGSIATNVTRSTGGWSFIPTYTWTASPSAGVSFGGSNSDATRTVTFGSSAAVGTYTITVTSTGMFGGSTSASTTITLTDGTLPGINMWAAKSIDNSTSRVETYSVNAGAVVSGPSTLFYTGETFAAMGRSPYPSPDQGYFYWIPYSAGNNGNLAVKGVNGDGSSTTTVVSSWDIDPTNNTDVTFVRFALDKNGVGWTLTGVGSGTGAKLNLTKIPFNTSPGFGLNSVTPVLEDDNVTLSGGTLSTFQNGDLCLDALGNIYALANITGGTTEIFIGQPNGYSTTLTKRWVIKDAAGNDFTGSVNGCAFDAEGAMYLTTGTGIYYLSPTSIDPGGGGTGVSTIRAVLVTQQSNYTDLGTNVFPGNTPMPARFGALSATDQNGSVVINWETLTEKDVKEFVIEASKDGKAWQEIGRVSSKALNGNSDVTQSYQFIAGSSLALGAVSLALLLLIPVFRSRLLKAALGIVVIMIVAVACTKQSDVVDVKKSDAAFIRIAQYDIGSDKPTYSKTILVVKQ